MQKLPWNEEKLKDAQKYAATVCQSDETYFLSVGSGCGILSAIFSATKQNGEVIMARNCQEAVYHGAELRELTTHYLYPEMLAEGMMGAVTVEMVEEALEKYPEAKTMIFISPTREGIISDVKAIVKAAHAKGVTVIVDESYGAHFLKESGFAKSAIRCGADVVIQDAHENLRAMNQSALLHINKDYRYKEKLRKYLSMFQSAGTSSEILQSIDWMMHWYIEEGREAYKNYLGRLKKLRAALGTRLTHLKLLVPENVFDYDISKVVISVKNCNISGEELGKQVLKKYQIKPEKISVDYVLFRTIVTDPEEVYGVLFDALTEIDAALEESPTPVGGREELGQRKVLMRICEAVEKKKKYVPLPESLGETSAGYIYIDPPGVPLLTPGEKISERCVRQLQYYLEENLKVRGLSKEREIEIIWEEYFT